MADPLRGLRPVAAVAAALFVVGLWGVGTGPVNGDAVVYAHQALQLDLTQRTIHIGYIAVAALLGLVSGDSLLTVLDVVTLGAASACVVCAGIIGRNQGGSGAFSAAWMAVGVLPVCFYAEVDVWWTALMLGAVATPHPAGLAAMMAAITVSPSALLAVPWVMVMRAEAAEDPAAERDAVLYAAGAAFVALAVLTGGDWLTGDRGVLLAQSIRPLRALEPWAQTGLPVLIAILLFQRQRPPTAFATLPLLLLVPSDAPGWLIPWAALSIETDRLGLRPRALLAALLVYSGLNFSNRIAQLRYDADVAQQVSESLGPDDALIAPWGWGVRVSVLETGDPYALLWTPIGEEVRHQRERWCAAAPRPLVVLPPGFAPEGAEWQVAELGWARTESPGALWYTLPKCEGP